MYFALDMLRKANHHINIIIKILKFFFVVVDSVIHKENRNQHVAFRIIEVNVYVDYMPETIS